MLGKLVAVTFSSCQLLEQQQREQLLRPGVQQLMKASLYQGQVTVKQNM